MLWYAIQKFNLESVEKQYLETGHTLNENATVYACIKIAGQPISVHTTAQWATVIRNTRRKNQYHVKEMDLPNLFDFKSVSKVLKHSFIQNKIQQSKYNSH